MKHAWIRRVRPWLARLGEFAATQGAIQALGMIAGVLIARWLPIESYAKYALVIAFTTAITVVGDSGIGSQVIAIGGRHNPVTLRIGSLIRHANRYRLIISAVVSAVATPALFWMLLRIDASWLEALFLCSLVVATVFITLRAGLYRSALHLLLEFRVAQISGMISSGVRVFGALALAPWPFLGAIAPTVSNAIATALQERMMKRALARSTPDESVEIDNDDRTTLLAAAKRLLPLNLILVAQNQGTGLMLGALGASVALAELTAISRYGIVLTMIPTVVVSVLGPAFARTAQRRDVVMKRLFTILAGSGLVILTVSTALAVSWRPLLSLLGDQYNGLRVEYWIVMTGTAIASIAIVHSGLNLSRGWAKGSWVMGPTALIWLVTGYFLLDVTSTQGAALFMAFGALPSVVTAVTQTAYGLIGEPRSKASSRTS